MHPLAQQPCWEPRARHGAILWSLRAGARRQAAGTRRRQPLERAPAGEAVALLVMEGNKSISKCCRATCFSLQQARGQQLQQPPCDASCAGCAPGWRVTAVQRAATSVWGFSGVSTSPSSFPAYWKARSQWKPHQQHRTASHTATQRLLNR